MLPAPDTASLSQRQKQRSDCPSDSTSLCKLRLEARTSCARTRLHRQTTTRATSTFSSRCVFLTFTLFCIAFLVAASNAHPIALLFRFAETSVSWRSAISLYYIQLHCLCSYAWLVLVAPSRPILPETSQDMSLSSRLVISSWLKDPKVK